MPLPIAFAPYGQLGPPSDAATEDADIKSLQTHWPTSLPSFEVWCQATLFDPSKGDGGERFQRLMHGLMIQAKGGQIETLNDSHFDVTKSGNARYQGDFVTNRPDRYITYFGNRGGTKPAFVGKVVAGYEPNSRGLPHGATSGRNLGFTGSGVKGMETPSSWRPYSKLDWFGKCGLQIGTGKTNQRQFIGDGKGGHRDCKEDNGCMNSGNTIAGFYGLYYYSGCQTDKYNWVMTQKVGSKQCAIRMRFPNPTYAREKVGGKIINVWCREPINNRWQPLQGNPGHTYVGKPEEGFKVNIMHEPKMNWPKWKTGDDGPRKRSPMAPFFGVDGEPKPGKFFGASGANLQLRGMRVLVRLLNKNGPAQDNLIYDYDKALEQNDTFHMERAHAYYGFNIPSATQLYPHVPAPVTLTPGFEAVKRAGTRDWGNYIPWPRWKRGVTRPDMYRGLSFYHQLYHPADLNIPLDKLAEYAIGEWQPPGPNAGQAGPSAPPPSSVQILQGTDEGEVSEEPDRPGERTEDDGAGLGLEDTPPLPDVTDQDAQADDDQTGEIRDEQGLGKTHILIGVTAQLQDNNELDHEISAAAWLGDEDQNDIALDMLKHENKENEAKLKKAFKKRLPKEPLPAGAKHKEKEENLNAHYKDANWQPWPHADLYEENKMWLQMEDMNEDEVKEYKEKYGSVSNLFLHSSHARKILGVNHVFGWPKQASKKARGGIQGMFRTLDEKKNYLDMVITAGVDESHPDHSWLTDEEKGMFNKHLKRIVSIYMADQYLSADISPDKKRQGMRGGLHTFKTTSAHGAVNVQYGIGRGAPPQNLRRDTFPPVFTNAPTASPANKEAFTYDADVLTDDHPLQCDDGTGAMPRTLEVTRRCARQESVISGLKSEMTVLEWVCSPWHYQHLPYTKQYSVFRDGETYTAGCLRCSRPFFEYS